MKKLLITSLFFVFLSASALGQPSGPHVLDGEVNLNNESITGTIEARYDGDVLSSTEAEDGEFSDLAVQNVEAGTEVDVYISGVEADQNVTYEPWAVEEKNFSASFEKEENVTVRNVNENVSKDEGLDIEVPEQASKEDSGVDGLNISVNEDVNDVEVNVTVSDETNDEVNKEEIQDVEDSGSTFLGVIDVDTNILEAARGSATIGFKVNKSVVAEPQDVVLIHYENGSRVGVLESIYRQKKTQNQNDDFYYLRADTSSFSSFAITSDTTDPDADAGEDVTVDAEEDVEFNASDSTDNVEIKNYTWEFSDQTLEGKTVENSFDDSGTYDVELTVYDTSGNSDTDTKTVTVESTANIQDLDSGSGTTQDDEQTDEDTTQENSSDTGSQDSGEDQNQDQQTDSNTSEEFTEASIGVTSMNVTPQSGTPPFDVEVQVEVENTGNASGTELIEVFAGNESIGSRNVSLESGSWTTLSFDHTVEEKGDLELSAGSETVKVSSEPKGISWIGVLAIIFALLAGGYFRREDIKERLGTDTGKDSSDSVNQDEGNLEYTCDECGSSFDSERGLSIHKGEVHGDGEE